MNQEKIGRFITQRRKEKGMTQQELGEKLGVSDRTVGNWENGRNMPDLSLFKPICEELEISINDFLSGEKIETENYQEKLEEKIINTIHYTSKKLRSKNYLIGTILIIFGTLIAMSAITIFPSESSWGSIFSLFGVIVSLIGISRFTKYLNSFKRYLCNFGYFIIVILLLFILDYISIVNIKQAPRFSLVKVTGEEVIYYDTPFYDVIRCNVNKENETFKVIKNRTYNRDEIDVFCK